MRDILRIAPFLLLLGCAASAEPTPADGVSGPSICSQAAEHIAACSGTDAVTISDCGSEDAAAAERLLALSCQTLADPGKADLWDWFKCSRLGKRMGMCVRVANDAEALSSLGAPAQRMLTDPRFSTLVWNIHKGSDEAWDADMLALGATVEIAMLQEWLGDGATDTTCAALDGYGWLFATSFFNDGAGGVPTGVATGGSIAPVSARFHRSPDREPETAKPKMALSTTYDLSWSDDDLLVLNVHAINFRGVGPFENQMDQLGDRLASHRGPVLVAGDFNTWRPARTGYLDEVMSDNGLEHVSLSDDDRFLVLDHVYVRGMSVRHAQLLQHYETSDHAPIYLDVEIDRGAAAN